MEKIAMSNKYCFVSDDIVISFVLDHTGIKKVKLNNQYIGIDKNFPFTYGFGLDALHKGGGLEESALDLNKEKYQKCNEYLDSFIKL